MNIGHGFLCIVINLFLCTYTVLAQDIRSIGPGAAATSMGSIKSVYTNIWALNGNQAGLGYIDNLSAYVSAEHRFGSTALRFVSFAGAIPTSFGTFGLSLQYYGFEAYNEQVLGLAYGRKLLDQLSIGVRFDYLQTRVLGYGQKKTFTLEGGLLTQVARTIHVGFHVYNPFQVDWVDGEELPAIFLLGVRYAPTEKVVLLAELEKVSELDENVKFGIQYTVVSRLSLRLGINTNPSLVTFGIGYRLDGPFSFDIGASTHQQLGFSPSGGIGYERIKLEE